VILKKAFQVKLASYKSKDGTMFRGRSGEIGIPIDLENIVDGVFGLGDRPHARPMFQVAGRKDTTIRANQPTIGGTSAGAPLMAGLVALVNQKNNASVGFINPRLYANPDLCRDITEGDNVTTSTHKGYKARKGRDACTGLGVLAGF
jgi:subtilase family serine protease